GDKARIPRSIAYATSVWEGSRRMGAAGGAHVTVGHGPAPPPAPNAGWHGDRPGSQAPAPRIIPTGRVAALRQRPRPPPRRAPVATSGPCGCSLASESVYFALHPPGGAGDGVPCPHVPGLPGAP